MALGPSHGGVAVMHPFLSVRVGRGGMMCYREVSLAIAGIIRVWLAYALSVKRHYLS
jgi:hypothetical protein